MFYLFFGQIRIIEKTLIKLTKIQRQKPHINKLIDERGLLQQIPMKFNIILRNNLKMFFKRLENPLIIKKENINFLNEAHYQE